MAEIVVVGSYNRDVAFFVPRLPAPGETCLSTGRLESPGGKGSNQAIQAARAGASVGMIAALGQDAAGDEALALWTAEGIDTRGVARLAAVGTGMAVILVDAAAENVIAVDSGANAQLEPTWIEAQAGLIGGARLVVAQLETPTASTALAFHLARTQGAETMLNAAPAPDSLDADLLGLTDILVVNEGEGRGLSGFDDPVEAGAALLSRVGRAVVVTLGSRGAMLFESGRAPVAMVPPRVEVVDTTGAGDAFAGAFAARWIASRDSTQALGWGLAAGALACTRKGASQSCALASEIERLASLA